MRYWLSIGDGKSYGPYTREELQAFVAEGRVNAAAMLCHESSEEWVPLPSVVAGVAPPRAPVMPGSGAVANPRRIRLGWAITVTVLSVIVVICVPIGVVPLVYANSANRKYAAGDTEGGARAERSYRTWMIVTWVLIALSIYLQWQLASWCSSMLGGVGGGSGGAFSL